MSLNIEYHGKNYTSEELFFLRTTDYVEENLVVILSFVIYQVMNGRSEALQKLVDGFTSVTRADLDRTVMAFPAFYEVNGRTGEEARHWHPPAEVAQAYDRLAEAFRRRESGAALLFDSFLEHLEDWERERLDNDVREPHEGDPIEPGDYYGYLALQLGRVAASVRNIAAAGETAVRLTVAGM